MCVALLTISLLAAVEVGCHGDLTSETLIYKRFAITVNNLYTYNSNIVELYAFICVLLWYITYHNIWYVSYTSGGASGAVFLCLCMTADELPGYVGGASWRGMA